MQKILIIYMILYCICNIIGFCNIVKIFGLCKDYRMKTRAYKLIYNIFFVIYSVVSILINKLFLKVILGIIFNTYMLIGLIYLIITFVCLSLNEGIEEKIGYSKSQKQEAIVIALQFMFTNLIPFLMLFYI